MEQPEVNGNVKCEYVENVNEERIELDRKRKSFLHSAAFSAAQFSGHGYSKGSGKAGGDIVKSHVQGGLATKDGSAGFSRQDGWAGRNFAAGRKEASGGGGGSGGVRYSGGGSGGARGGGGGAGGGSFSWNREGGYSVEGSGRMSGRNRGREEASGSGVYSSSRGGSVGRGGGSRWESRQESGMVKSGTFSKGMIHSDGDSQMNINKNQFEGDMSRGGFVDFESGDGSEAHRHRVMGKTYG